MSAPKKNTASSPTTTFINTINDQQQSSAPLHDVVNNQTLQIDSSSTASTTTSHVPPLLSTNTTANNNDKRPQLTASQQKEIITFLQNSLQQQGDGTTTSDMKTLRHGAISEASSKHDVSHTTVSRLWNQFKESATATTAAAGVSNNVIDGDNNGSNAARMNQSLEKPTKRIRRSPRSTNNNQSSSFSSTTDTAINITNESPSYLTTTTTAPPHNIPLIPPPTTSPPPLPIFPPPPTITPRNNKSKQLTNTQRKQLLQYLLQFKDPTDQTRLNKGAIQSASTAFGVSPTTVHRIWNAAKSSYLKQQERTTTSSSSSSSSTTTSSSNAPLAITDEWASCLPDVSGRKINSGRRPKDYSRQMERIASIPLNERGSLRTLSSALGIPRSTLFRLLKKADDCGHDYAYGADSSSRQKSSSEGGGGEGGEPREATTTTETTHEDTRGRWYLRRVEELRLLYDARLTALRRDILQKCPAVDKVLAEQFLTSYREECAAWRRVHEESSSRKSVAPTATAAADDDEANDEDNNTTTTTTTANETEHRRHRAHSLHLAHQLLTPLRPFLTQTHDDLTLYVPCAVISDGTPKGLAQYAARGEDETALIEKLLGDGRLMRDFLVGGGPKGKKWGEAMQIYVNLMSVSKHLRKLPRRQQAAVGKQPLEDNPQPNNDSNTINDDDSQWDPTSRRTVLHRLALATALEHATPLKEFDHDAIHINPITRYLHYERAYLNGELDPSFETLSTWDLRFVVNANAPEEQLSWGREMLRNYRPDIVTREDEHWRYVDVVRTDVRNKKPEWTGCGVRKTYAQLINGGGGCGPRAWFGRFILRAFGIPTWGARQKGFASLAHRTEEGGWVICLGADWRFNWWEDRSGLDFKLETRAREYTEEFKLVLKCQWVGEALGENKVHGNRPGTGDLWNVLGLYQKKMIVDAEERGNGGLRRCRRRRQVHDNINSSSSSSLRMTKLESTLNNPILPSDTTITIEEDGSIIIPAAACTTTEQEQHQLIISRSFLGQLQLHHKVNLHTTPPQQHQDHHHQSQNSQSPPPYAFEYSFHVPDAGAYIFKAFVVTVHAEQQLVVTANYSTTPIVVSMPYTMGYWMWSPSVYLSLMEGTNVLSFSRVCPHGGLSIKSFTLSPAW